MEDQLDLHREKLEELSREILAEEQRERAKDEYTTESGNGDQ